MTHVLAASTESNAASSVLKLVLIVLAIVAYLVPTIIALFRIKQIPNVGSIIVINAFLGWTVVGWVLALAMVVRKPYSQAPPYGSVEVPPNAPAQPWVPPTAQWHDPGGMAG